MTNRIPISAVLVVKNEGHILREYFEHLKLYVDEFIVADQCSTDNSIEICKEYGARVFRTKDWGYSEPDKEFVLKQIKNNWAITLDPDERFSNEILFNLQNIMSEAEKNRCDSVSFNVKFIMDGYEIESMSKDITQIRIVRKDVKCFTRIHSNYDGMYSLQVNLNQYHYKHTNDHMNKEDVRVKLNISKEIVDKTKEKNSLILKELEFKHKETEKINKTFKSDYYKFPKKILIETSVNCNAKCIMCPNNKIKRINREMSLENFKKIIDSLVDKEVEEIHPFIHGEPFVVKDIFKMMSYINEVLPTTKIVLFSNAGVLNEAKSKELINIKNIKSITFSVDASTKETYEKIRVGLNFETTINNILKFLELNKQSNTPINTSVSMTISDINRTEYDTYYNFWKDKVDSIDGHRCTGRNKEIRAYGNYIELVHFRQIPCKILFEMLAINTDGNVVMCCEDFTPKVTLGNVFETSIEEIWNSEKFNKIRKAHIEHKKYDLDVCKNCDVNI